MHDWILVSVSMDWANGRLVIFLRNSRSEGVPLIADGVLDLQISRRQDWGESCSINRVEGPSLLDTGAFRLMIEMQSGDLINVEAQLFKMPALEYCEAH